MPENGELNRPVSNPANASPDDELEERMWGLKVDDGPPDWADGHGSPYPYRPGEPNCIFYMRTGTCGYGSKCRYNHPAYYFGQYGGELPQREGQPDCQFFLKTGTCRFGGTCKYHHPRDKVNAQPIQLNYLGLPIREGEKPCAYYMRTGSCKFGVACKFNHPQPSTSGYMFPVTSGSSAYGSTASSMVSPSGLPLMGGLSTWPFSRTPYAPHSHLLLPPNQSTMPMQHGWSAYTDGVNQISSAKNHTESGSSTPSNLPDRPGQPDCQYFMKTGTCKYGTSCKYHHPKERRNQVAVSTVGPLGLPLRPGEPVCNFYTMYGSCKYGSACKYDHPQMVGYYNYNYNYAMPALSIQDPSVMFPNQRSSQVTVTAPQRSPPKAEASDDDPADPSSQSSPSNNEPHSQSTQDQSDQN
ncbi:zinc finger CCCH domain-containing protein 63-like isoform X2 [Ananas comosus]|uniref:Zinc finger CCCH domain-containing protein 63-like isoform X2 n=1 Tax=Ananas comosus TaxID=4615 RepID=A0A6P5FUR0_ANACO|nr:zinc finger CCCH domain-containing protein 63-like isoform X2 [Ananas comosus]